ncbi:MAG: cytochrome C oxidase subunit IV family protein [Thermoanaerobaculia bacterium]
MAETITADPLTHEHEQHAGVVDPNVHHGHTPEEIRKEMRVYITVFICLGILTLATVGACYGLKLPSHMAILVALIIASIKAGLVAAFFMHLISERKVIYAVLGLTLTFFGILLWLPVHDWLDKFGKYGAK